VNRSTMDEVLDDVEVGIVRREDNTGCDDIQLANFCYLYLRGSIGRSTFRYP
jgi:hypothetical protein